MCCNFTDHVTILQLVVIIRALISDWCINWSGYVRLDFEIKGNRVMDIFVPRCSQTYRKWDKLKGFHFSNVCGESELPHMLR